MKSNRQTLLRCQRWPGILPSRRSLAVTLVLFFLSVFWPLVSNGLSADQAIGSKQTESFPPHIVIYLSDCHSAHSESALPRSAGMTFTRAVASASGTELGRRAFESGKAFENGSDSRTLGDYLKQKGYRLLSLGDSVEKDRLVGDFQFQVISETLDRFDLKNSPDRLAEFLTRETQRDHRPLCLLVRDRTGLEQSPENRPGSAALVHTFAAVQNSLPPTKTIFVATAICGRGIDQKSDSISKCPLNIPLTLVWEKHIPAGRTMDALVSAVDILPTIVELIGSTPPSEIDGRSFASLVRGESLEHRDVAFSVIDQDDDEDKFCVHDSRFLYITSYQQDATTELFDLLSDPERRVNLAQDPSMAQRCSEMREQLNLWLGRHGKMALPAATES